MTLALAALAATTPAMTASPTAGDLPVSSTARLADFSFKGWEIEVYADVVRGALGASEAVCILARRVTYRDRQPVEKVEVREAGCVYDRLGNIRAEARLFRVDPAAWEGVASAESIKTFVWRDVYRWSERRGDWSQVDSDEWRGRARVELRWAGIAGDPGGQAWWAGGLTPSAQPPLCFYYGPPFIGPCPYAKAGASRPAAVIGTVGFARLGSFEVKAAIGAMSLHWDPIGYHHG